MHMSNMRGIDLATASIGQLYFLLIGFALMSSISFAVAFSMHYHDYILGSRGIKAVAIVTDKHEEYGGSVHKQDFLIRYVFSTKDGTEYHGEDRVDLLLFNKVRSGQNIAIEYLASDPRDNRISPTSPFFLPNRLKIWLDIGGAIVFVFFLIVLVAIRLRSHSSTSGLN